MRTPSEVGTEWVERKLDRLLAPNGLMTVVGLILLSVFILSGSGVERRTMAGTEAESSRVWTSPLLGDH